MITDENLINLNKSFYTQCKAKARIFTLLSLPSLLVVLVFLAYVKILPLQMELHSLILISFVYFIYLFFVAHNAYYVSCKFKSLYKSLVTKLKEYINSNSLTIGEVTKTNGSVDDFLKDFTSNIRNTNFSSIASGVFPTLGILGTFISIAFSMPDFSSGNTSALEKEISVLLGGVGTAFYISIYGIFLSLWWTFFEKIGMSRFEHDVYIIKEHTKSFFWTKLDIESIHIKNSLDNYEKMTKVFEKLTSIDILNSLERNIKQRAIYLENIVNKELQVSTNLDKNLQDTKSLSKIIEALSLNANKNINLINQQQELFLNTSKELNSNVEKISKSLDNLNSDNLEKVYENIIKNIETMKNDTDRIGWRFNKELDEYDNKFSLKLQTSLNEIDQQTVKIIKDLEEFRNLSK